MASNPMQYLEVLRKLEVPIIIMIAVVLALMLFLPDGIADTLSEKVFRDSYRTYLGPAFLLALALLITKIALGIRASCRHRRRTRAMFEQLHLLTAEERGYLCRFIFGGVNTIYVGIQDGVAGGLVVKGILYRASSIGSMLDGFAHNLQPWAREYLEQHPELLEGASGTPMPPRKLMGMR
jgi:hypothetical protein